MADHVEGYAPLSLPRRTLLLVAGGGLVAASAITMLFVLPAEFGLDPTGFGRLTGLNKLRGAQVVAPVAAPTGSAARSYPVAFRTDTFEDSAGRAGHRSGACGVGVQGEHETW